ncbi:MAG TPA: flavodoxin [Candidatus Enterenecus merdae]|nr:flavodoxin [Candidatus Enterenecus merdae]
MKKVAVVYWSMGGNTAAMAEAVTAGAQEAGAEVLLRQVSETTTEEVLACDAIALGCPAMGAEVLEEAEFEPFFTQLEGSLGGREVALFGSYGWGDGQWMRDWWERTQSAGALLVGDEGLIINEAPDADGLEQCRSLGASLAK